MDSLKTLHTALIDARKGYETARDDATKADMRSMFEKMIDLHERSHRDIHAILSGLGERPDDGGSFMATVHKTVFSVRAAVSGLGPDALSSFADGEEHILGLYDDAISGNSGDATTTAILKRHHAALLTRISEMKRKAA